MKKLMMLFTMLAIFMVAGAQTITFTPGEYSQGKLMPDGVVYDRWEWKTNVAGIKDRFPLSTFNQSQTQYKIVKLKSPVTLHWTEIEQAGTQDNPKWVGMNWLLSKSYNLSVGAKSLAKTYIKEDGADIAALIETYKLGNITQPAILSTNYAYNVGQEFYVTLWANETTTFMLPDHVQFMASDIMNFGYTQNMTWTKFFDYNVVVEGQSITIEITNKFNFDSAVKKRGLRHIGLIKLKATTPGQGYVQGVQEGYIYIE